MHHGRTIEKVKLLNRGAYLPSTTRADPKKFQIPTVVAADEFELRESYQ